MLYRVRHDVREIIHRPTGLADHRSSEALQISDIDHFARSVQPLLRRLLAHSTRQ